MSTALVWFRRDLRLHDHPPLWRALHEHEHVVPVFVLDPALVGGRFPSGSRTAFLLACLRELDAGLRERGAALVVRHGRPGEQLVALAREVGAEAVHWASDVSPYARARDRGVTEALRAADLRAVPAPGTFAADIGRIRTQEDRPYTVFSPFWRTWLRAERRPVHRPPAAVPTPEGVRAGTLPAVEELNLHQEVDGTFAPGEGAARERVARWLSGGLDLYHERNDRLAGGSSELSPYLHFGCISARELEERVARRDGPGPEAYRRQLCWRDFYGHVLLFHPDNAVLEHQERYRDLEWDDDPDLFDAWREGRTGYPLVDAGMRQLRAVGWMHNRARLVVGSFLTKDLHLDWRAGEAHFMRYLLDGDEANNNGNWQWIASVGVDPEPFYRRLYNPARHRERFDPDGEYVRRWVPELAGVPLKRLDEPWSMSDDEQREAGCVVGRDYPAPIVDHKVERERTAQRYRAAAERGHEADAPDPGSAPAG